MTYTKLTYTQFKENLEKLNKAYNYQWIVSGDSTLIVRDSLGNPLASISSEVWLNHSFDYVGFRKLPEDEKTDLFTLVFTLSRTPLQDRGLSWWLFCSIQEWNSNTRLRMWWLKGSGIMQAGIEMLGTVIISIALMIFAYKITRWWNGKNNSYQRGITNTNTWCS